MASGSVLWFIQVSTVASNGDSAAAAADEEVVEVEVKAWENTPHDGSVDDNWAMPERKQ